MKSVVLPLRLARMLPRGLLAPALVALSLRLALAAAMPVAPVWDGVIYERAGSAIAAGEGLTRASISATQPAEPTAFYPIGFPAMIAALRWVGGGRGLDLIVQCLLGAALVPMCGLLGRRAGGARVGRVSAWIVALWPGGVLLSLSWMSEPLFALLIAAASLVVAWSRRAHRTRALVIATIVLALAAYVRPTSIPISIVLALMLALGVASNRARALAVARHLAIVLVVTLAVLSPWALRNARVLGAPVLVSTNGGANLLLGTIGEGRFGVIPDALDCPAELTEIQKERCRTRLALARIVDAPADFVARALLKLTHTFGHESGPAYAFGSALRVDERTRDSATLWALALSRTYWHGLFAASLAGAALLLRRRASPVLAALLAPPLGIALLHVVVLGGDRYHAPAVPMLAVLAALALVAWRPSPARRSEGAERPRDHVA